MGTLYLVGIGPGDRENLTRAAAAVMEKADILCGYETYVKLAKQWYPEKETFTTPMRREQERCRKALELARSGKCVAMLCSGDAGVYGMAGLVMEMAGDEADPEIIVIPGITAAVSGAALLGAPLSNDFCVVSLSDQLTKWETIERRLRGAAAGGFPICIYNPASRQRPDHLRKACEILLDYRPGDTVCGWVRNIGRDGQEIRITTLDGLKEEKVDMLTTVYVGGEDTILSGGRMVTRRGYRGKE